jgi:hypothetical protein
MSKIENPKKVLKKTLFFRLCDENALNHRKNHSKNVTIKIFIFFEKYLEIFSLETLWKLLETKFSQIQPLNFTVFFVTMEQARNVIMIHI